ncbi:MAG: UspA domain protein [Nocardioides sp.]|nr:UspA domain protein [Nocardioides sp.]
MTSPTTPAAGPSGTIVVAIDGSPGGEQALGWAVEQAVIEHRPLTIAHASHLTMGGDTLWMGQPGIDVSGLLELVEAAGHELLDAARQQVLDEHPDLAVHTRLNTSLDARRMLLDLAEDAAMLVVGSRGRGPVASVLLGSVSATVAKHAACPVVVVRLPAGTAPRSGVVVAVDDREESRTAVELGYRLASCRSLPLTVLRVVWDPTHLGDDEHVVTDDDRGLEGERSWLSQAAVGMREKFPDVQDQLELVRGTRVHQLVRASQGADLLVLGRHPQNLVDDFLFGSVASVLERAECDVVVVHGGPAPTS